VLVSPYEYGCSVNPEAPDIEQFRFNVPSLPLFNQVARTDASLDPSFPQARGFRVVCSPHSR
jgi:hypothetical protein